FFQAEDGIRDRTVTGVQTCALPIWDAGAPPEEVRRKSRKQDSESDGAVLRRRGDRTDHDQPAGGNEDDGRHRMAEDGPSEREERSEERRVGKECRCGWAG